jgi:hypothetical protein
MGAISKICPKNAPGNIFYFLRIFVDFTKYCAPVCVLQCVGAMRAGGVGELAVRCVAGIFLVENCWLLIGSRIMYVVSDTSQTT